MAKPYLPTRRLVVGSLAASAGGLLVGFAGDAGAQTTDRGGSTRSADGRHELAEWIEIGVDGRVVVRIAREELGQGTATALAQLVAEELECDWKDVGVEFPSPGVSRAKGRKFGDFATSASRGLRNSQHDMRLAGAAARQMLVRAAAEAWTVRQDEIVTRSGRLLHEPSGRSASYGAFAEAASRLVPPPVAGLRLKDQAKWTIAGQEKPRHDTRAKISGVAVYGIDVQLPGMLMAAITEAPVIGARVADYEAGSALAIEGVRGVVRVGESAVAVVAESWWLAHRALQKLDVRWVLPAGPLVSSESIERQLAEGLDAPQAFVGQTHGDALKAMRGAARTVEATYAVPYLHHMTLEPVNCTALWTPTRVDVWAGVQSAESALQAAADVAGLPVENAELHRVAVGGAFGRRIRSDFVTDAVRIARQFPGTPVKVIWSREQDTTHGYYRPITQCRLSGGIDDKGEPVGLIMRISGQSILASHRPASSPVVSDPRMFQGLTAAPSEAQMGYSIPNVYIDHAMRNTPVPVGSWRGVHTTQNALYLECFIDEMAVAAKRDPLEFRRAMMRSHPYHQGVLIAATERARWSERPPPGRHRGLAQYMAFGSYTAAVAEVSVAADGTVRVHKVVLAVDCGTIANPGLVRAQIEGAVAMGVSATLHEEIRLWQGFVLQRNFDSYRVLRMAEMPEVEAVLVPSGQFWGGVGSATIAVVAPAVLNAIFAATGVRVRRLPVRRVVRA